MSWDPSQNSSRLSLLNEAGNQTNNYHLLPELAENSNSTYSPLGINLHYNTPSAYDLSGGYSTNFIPSLPEVHSTTGINGRTVTHYARSDVSALRIPNLINANIGSNISQSRASLPVELPYNSSKSSFGSNTDDFQKKWMVEQVQSGGVTVGTKAGEDALKATVMANYQNSVGHVVSGGVKAYQFADSLSNDFSQEGLMQTIANTTLDELSSKAFSAVAAGVSKIAPTALSTAVSNGVSGGLSAFFSSPELNQNEDQMVEFLRNGRVSFPPVSQNPADYLPNPPYPAFQAQNPQNK